MRHEEAERRIRALQKSVLLRFEEHPVFEHMTAADFNNLRKRVFRGTFAAYRLGVIGLVNEPAPLWTYFFGWIESLPTAQTLPADVRLDATEICFRTALEAYRLGAMVAVDRDES